MDNNNTIKIVLLSLIVLILGFGLGIATYYILDKTERISTQNNQNIEEREDENDKENQDTSDDKDNENTDGNSNPADDNNLTVYFFDRAKFDNSESEFFVPAARTTTRTDVATFVVEQIIIGPNETEQAQGLENTFGVGHLVQIDDSSVSDCNGKDFEINILNKDATVRFCREVSLAGDLSGSIVRNQIVKTLKQFNTIERVRILNNENSCFDNMSGMETTECYD